MISRLCNSYISETPAKEPPSVLHNTHTHHYMKRKLLGKRKSSVFMKIIGSTLLKEESKGMNIYKMGAQKPLD